MKVLHVTGLMNRGGAEVLIMDFLRYKTNDIQFDFLIHQTKLNDIQKGDFDNEILLNGCNIFNINTLWSLGFRSYVNQLIKIFEQSRPDCIHIHMNGKSGVIAYAAHKFGIKTIIIHSHANIKYRGNLLYRLLANTEFKFQKYLIDKYATEFWGCSLEACESLFYKRRKKQFKVISNSIDVDKYLEVDKDQINKFRSSLNLPDNAIILGNVGRIVTHKNIDFIIDLLAVLLEKNPNYYFVYAGREVDTDYHQLVKDKINNYGLNNHVKYLGLRDDIEIFMNSIDIFISPALQEGFGLVAVEAQAADKPTLIYTGFPKIVDMDLGHVNFLDQLDEKIWVEKIMNLEFKNLDKQIIKSRIIELGFDSKHNGLDLSKIYKKLYEN